MIVSRVVLLVAVVVVVVGGLFPASRTRRLVGLGLSTLDSDSVARCCFFSRVCWSPGVAVVVVVVVVKCCCSVLYDTITLDTNPYVRAIR